MAGAYIHLPHHLIDCVREREREKKMYILIAPMTPENICVPKQTIPIGSEGEFPSDLYLTRGQ